MVIYLIVAVIIVLCVLHGFSSGILKCIYNLLVWIFILIFAYMATPMVTTWLTEETELQTMAYEAVYDALLDQFHDYEQAISDRVKEETLTLMQENTVKRVEAYLPDEAKTAVETAVSSGIDIPDDTVTPIIESTATQVAETLMKGLSILISIIAGRIIAWIVWLFISAADKLPGIHTVSHLLGAILGFAEGIVLVWIVIYLVVLMSEAPLFADMLDTIMDTPPLLWLYEHDILLAFMQR